MDPLVKTEDPPAGKTSSNQQTLATPTDGTGVGGGGDIADEVYIAPSAIDVIRESEASFSEGKQAKEEFCDPFEDPFSERLSQMLEEPPLSPPSNSKEEDPKSFPESLPSKDAPVTTFLETSVVDTEEKAQTAAAESTTSNLSAVSSAGGDASLSESEGLKAESNGIEPDAPSTPKDGLQTTSSSAAAQVDTRQEDQPSGSTLLDGQESEISLQGGGAAKAPESTDSDQDATTSVAGSAEEHPSKPAPTKEPDEREEEKEVQGQEANAAPGAAVVESSESGSEEDPPPPPPPPAPPPLSQAPPPPPTESSDTAGGTSSATTTTTPTSGAVPTPGAESSAAPPSPLPEITTSSASPQATGDAPAEPSTEGGETRPKAEDKQEIAKVAEDAKDDEAQEEDESSGVVAEATVFFGDTVVAAAPSNGSAKNGSGGGDGDRVEVDLEGSGGGGAGGATAAGALSDKEAAAKAAQSIRAVDERVISDLKVVEGLGRGSFSAVLLAQLTSDPSKVFALKITDKVSILNPKQRRRLQAERIVLGELPPHPFLARLEVSFQTSAELFYLMEYCPGGSLGTQLSKIHSRGIRFKDTQARVWLSELVLALEHLQSFGFVHRDMKSDNVMLDSHGHIKLIDFGLCKRIRTSASELSALKVQQQERLKKQLAELSKYRSGSSPKSTPKRARAKFPSGGEDGVGGGGGFPGVAQEPMSPCGSLAFMAPEFFSPKESLGSFAVDWWGLGAVSCELLMGKLPWKHAALSGPNADDADISGDLLKLEVSEGVLPPLPSFLTAEAASFIKGLMDKAVWRRLGFFAENQVRAHPFFKGVDWGKVLERQYDPPFHPCRVPAKASAAPPGGGSVIGLRNFERSDRHTALQYYIREEAVLLTLEKKRQQPTTEEQPQLEQKPPSPKPEDAAGEATAEEVAAIGQIDPAALAAQASAAAQQPASVGAVGSAPRESGATSETAAADPATTTPEATTDSSSDAPVHSVDDDKDKAKESTAAAVASEAASEAALSAPVTSADLELEVRASVAAFKVEDETPEIGPEGKSGGKEEEEKAEEKKAGDDDDEDAELDPAAAAAALAATVQAPAKLRPQGLRMLLDGTTDRSSSDAALPSSSSPSSGAAGGGGGSSPPPMPDAPAAETPSSSETTETEPPPPSLPDGHPPPSPPSSSGTPSACGEVACASAVDPPPVLFRGFDLSASRPMIGEAVPWEWWLDPTASAQEKRQLFSKASSAVQSGAPSAPSSSSTAAAAATPGSTGATKRGATGRARSGSTLGGTYSWLKSMMSSGSSKKGGK